MLRTRQKESSNLGRIFKKRKRRGGGGKAFLYSPLYWDQLVRFSPTSFPGLFPFELGRREKTLASAGHVPILHPKILGVIN